MTLTKSFQTSTFGYIAGDDMDIFEQVDHILQNIETREKKKYIEHQEIEGLVLEELITRYNQFMKNRQWERAHNCLLEISRLVTAMLSQ
jgi:hypothetical protein